MTTRWDSFNSRLLGILHKKWYGAFHAKFFAALKTLEEQKDLEQAVQELFSPSDNELSYPQAIKSFGLGNIGRDQGVLLFLDNAVFESILGILQGEGRHITSRIELMLNSLGILDDQRHQTIKRYAKLLSFLAMIATLNPAANTQPLRIKIKNREDVAFLGCLSLLDSLFLKKGIYKKTPYIAYAQELSEDKTANHLGIDTDILEELALQVSEKTLGASTSIPEWLMMNRSAHLEKERLNLQEILPEVLSTSSSLYSPELLDVSMNRIYAMTEEERVLLLMEKKEAVLERCFDHLKNKLGQTGSAFMTLDKKNALIAKGRRIKDLLELKASKQAVYNQWNGRMQRLKASFLSIAQEQGKSARKAALDLLKLVSKKTLPLLEAPFLSGSEKNALILRLLKEYQKALIEKAKAQEEIVLIGENLKTSREAIEEDFNGIMKQVREGWLEERNNEVELLKVYATFSFVLLNKDLFPPVSLKKETQKKGAKKLSALMEKWKKKSAFQALQEKPNALEEPSFQEIINKQVKKVYRAYQPQSESYKVRYLSEEEINTIAKTASNIQEMARRQERGAAEKFFQLERILEKLLIEDHAFLASLDVAGKLKPERASSMQAHIEAALLFAKDQNSEPLTGETNASAFEKLLNEILKNLSSDGIKEKIEKSSLELVRQAQELALPVRQDTAVQILSKDIAGHSFEELKNQRLQLVPLSQRKPPRAQELQKAYSLLKDYFEHQLYSEDYRWLQSYKGIEDFFRNLPGKTKEITFGRHGLLDIAPFHTLPSGVKRWIQELITPNKEREFFLAFRRFFQDNDFKISTLKSKSSGLFKESLEKDHIMMFIPMIANALKDEAQSMEDKRQKYQVVLNSNPLAAERQIDIFANQTLFQFFDRKKKDSKQDSQRADGIYYDFLPIFISSFLSTERLLQKEGEKLRAAKMQFIEQMPFARILFEEFEEWISTNQAGIKKLHDYLEEETRKNVALLENDPQALTTFMEETFKKGKALFDQYVQEPTGGYLEGMKSWALSSSVITGGMLIAFAKYGVFAAAGIVGFVPLMIGTVLLSCVGAALLQEMGTPFLKTLIHTLWENFQNLLQVGDYGEAGPARFLLKTFEAAFLNELRAFDQFEETQHRLSYTFYMQELFEVMSHLQKNLLSFREKIHSLIPNTTKEANFSVMALNMFCMLSKDLFVLVPQEILQDVKNPHFLGSIEEYLLSYKQALEMATQDFQGESRIEYGYETPYSRFLKARAEEGKIVVRFAPSSKVGRFFDSKEVAFAITPEQIVPFQNIHPKQIATNVQSLLETSRQLLKKRERFEHDLRGTLQKTELAFKQPLNSKNKHQTYGLISCFEIVRYAFSLTKMLNDSEHLDVSAEMSQYLSATQASGGSILSSHLFHAALSSLRKTAEFASALEVPEGKTLLRLLKEISGIQEEFLGSGILHYPSFALWQEIKKALFTLLDTGINEHPMIAYPILVEFDVNKGLFLPLIIWNGFKQSLLNAYGEDAIELVPMLNDSKILYLTNTEDTILFTSPETRGFAVSPFLVEAMHQVVREYTNQELGQFLGRLSSRMQELNAAESAPLRYQLPFMRPLQERQPNRSIENAPYEIPLQQSYMQPQSASNRVLPDLGLSPRAYDPDNLGLSPEDAYVYYGDRLPEGVRNAIRSSVRQMEEGAPIENAAARSNPQRSSQQASSSNAMLLPIGAAPAVETQSEAAQVAAEAPIQIGVNAQGETTSLGSTSETTPYDAEAGRERMLGEVQAGNRRLEDRGQGPSFPPGPNAPYVNPINQQYDPNNIPENGFSWGKAATIGAGAALGMGALAHLMKDKDEKKRKRP